MSKKARARAARFDGWFADTASPTEMNTTPDEFARTLEGYELGDVAVMGYSNADDALHREYEDAARRGGSSRSTTAAATRTRCARGSLRARSLRACSRASFASAAASGRSRTDGSSSSRRSIPGWASGRRRRRCFTVVDASNGTLSFDLLDETIARAKPFGAEVNSSRRCARGATRRALRAGSRRRRRTRPCVRGRAAHRRGARGAPRYCVEKGSISPMACRSRSPRSTTMRSR